MRLLFLEMAGIGQHDRTQINSRSRGVDGTMKTLGDQPRNVAGVVEMSMSKDNGVYFTGRDWRVLPVALTPFFLPLE